MAQALCNHRHVYKLFRRAQDAALEAQLRIRHEQELARVGDQMQHADLDRLRAVRRIVLMRFSHSTALGAKLRLWTGTAALPSRVRIAVPPSVGSVCKTAAGTRTRIALGVAGWPAAACSPIRATCAPPCVHGGTPRYKEQWQSRSHSSAFACSVTCTLTCKEWVCRSYASEAKGACGCVCTSCKS